MKPNAGMNRVEYNEYRRGWMRLMQPCPGCGNTNLTIYRTSRPRIQNALCWRGFCADCGMKGPIMADYPGAVRGWNSPAWRGRIIDRDIWVGTSIDRALVEMRAICDRLDQVQEIVNIVGVEREN